MRHIIVIVVLFMTGPISLSEMYGGHPVGEGQTCAGLAGDRCEEGLHCDIPLGGGPFPPGLLCGASDAPGTCVKVIEDCPLTPEEVCGCDGETYMNDCVRIQSTCTKGQQRKMLDSTSIATVSAPCAGDHILDERMRAVLHLPSISLMGERTRWSRICRSGWRTHLPSGPVSTAASTVLR